MNLNFEEEVKREKRIKIIKECIIWIVEIAIVIAIAYFVIHFCFMRTTPIGSNMEPTLYNGEEVFVNKKAYMLSSPDREDVVAFYDREIQTEEGEEPLLAFRRVIGLPGETVQIVDGKILIDKKEWTSKYTFDPIVTAGIAEQEITLGEDEYFVLCDARADSDDSRNVAFGNVTREQIIGKVSFRQKPFARVKGPVETAKETEKPE